MENNNKFTYHYSSKQQEQVKQIRDKYLTKEDSKIERLNKLDQSVTTKARIIAISFGTISSLFFGLGLYMTIDLADSMFIQGIVIGVIGLIGTGVTFPLFNRILRKERQKIAAEILRLSDEIMSEN